ncbi:gem-associated protein 5-like [Xyrauchen texanus]|uniref:gem-associated protein 5-like n=1 Tax=Xyrauchen texanus TaxID=154827 RepID=UPI00224220C6|nr:gem-associated protein 5-like [Xyrauchen texanus]
MAFGVSDIIPAAMIPAAFFIRALQKKSKKKKKASGKGGLKAEENELPLGEENKGAGGSGAEEGQSDNEEEERQTADGPSVTGLASQSSVDSCAAERVQNREKPIHAVKREVKEEKRRDKSDLSLKNRKPCSILTLSTSMDHRPKEELQQDCLVLAAVKHSHELAGVCVPGSRDHIQLGLFTDRDAIYRMFQEEAPDLRPIVTLTSPRAF